MYNSDSNLNYISSNEENELLIHDNKSNVYLLFLS